MSSAGLREKPGECDILKPNEESSRRVDQLFQVPLSKIATGFSHIGGCWLSLLVVLEEEWGLHTECRTFKKVRRRELGGDRYRKIFCIALLSGQEKMRWQVEGEVELEEHLEI
jgi:hypothetical protein